MKVYIAGPLFSEGDIRSRRFEAEMFKDQIPNIEIFNPIDAPYNEDKDSFLPTPVDIYLGDYNEIITSDFLVFNFEDIYDPGVALEIGLVCGDPNSKTVLVGVMSDIRLPNAPSYKIPPYGTNHMVLGAIEKNGYLVSSYQLAVDLVKNIVEINK